MSSRTDVAADQVKRVFSSSMAAGGGGRGGSPSAVFNKAARSAQFAACIFADFFTETEKDFDPDAFFLACCLPDAFIERMAKARGLAERKSLDSAWRSAKAVQRKQKASR